jgi:prephenate dehydrogenase
MAAVALVTLAASRAEDDDNLLKIAAGGFKDTTRVASGSADLWTGILSDNADIVADELAEYGRIIAECERLIRERDASSLRRMLSAAAATRDSLT